MARQITLRAGRLELQASLEGPSEAPLIMLVHGFPDTPHGWGPVAQSLIQAGYQVLRPWLRGYTPGSVHPQEDYDAWSAGQDLLAWRAEFPQLPVHLVGHDWGAVASMVAAVSKPPAWASLSILAIPPFQKIHRAWAQLPRQFVYSSYMLEMQSRSAPAAIQAHDCLRLRQLWAAWSPGWDFTAAEFEPVRLAFQDEGVAWAATRYYRSLFTPWKARTRALYACAFRPVQVPTLALTGAQDGCMQSSLFDAAADPSSFPAAYRMVRLPESGHFLQIENPQAVTCALLEHIQAH